MAKKPAQIFHFDLYGKREDKYDFLNENSMQSIQWEELHPQKPNLFFVPKDYEVKENFDKGFSILDLFIEKTIGIQTHRDHFAIDENPSALKEKIDDLTNQNIENDTILEKYSLRETNSWKLNNIRKKLNYQDAVDSIMPCAYRLFDNRYVITHPLINDRPRTELLKNYSGIKNLTLLLPKQQSIEGFYHVFIVDKIASDCTLSSKSREGNTFFPLYLYPDNSSTLPEGSISERVPNLNMEIVDQISKKLRINFVSDENLVLNMVAEGNDIFTPLDILDYIYAVLHSPTYREKYKEFLKIDFPRVPYPKDQKTFWKLVKLGGEIRQIHLLESSVVEDYITQYPIDGDNIVSRKITMRSPGYVPETETHGKVYINDAQYFDNVPLVAWEFYIGGYQPAQKWLKDRYDRELDFDDILHYQKIIVALTETDSLMKEIDKIDFM